MSQSQREGEREEKDINKNKQANKQTNKQKHDHWKTLHQNNTGSVLEQNPTGFKNKPIVLLGFNPKSQKGVKTP